MFSRIPNPRFLFHEIFLVFSRKALLLDKVNDKALNIVKFATFESLASTERLSTVSSPFIRYSRVLVQSSYLQSFEKFSVFPHYIFLSKTFGSSKSNKLASCKLILLCSKFDDVEHTKYKRTVGFAQSVLKKNWIFFVIFNAKKLEIYECSFYDNVPFFA